MQIRNILTQLAICSLYVLFATAGVKAEENPIKPRTSNKLPGPTNQFECGVYKGSEREIFGHYYHHQAKLKKLQKNGARLLSRDFVFDDVAVIEDDGTTLIVGVNTFDTDNSTFHFAPNSNSGYDISTVAFNFDTDLGTNLNLGDDTNATVNTSFTFDYYGQSWTDFHVGANGIVSFGADINPSGFFSADDFFGDLPKIAAYFMDLDPSSSGAVFSKAESNKLTITWNQIPAFGTTDQNTIQLVLHDDGTFDVTFNGIESLTQSQMGQQIPIAFGVHPGGVSPNQEVISFSNDLPYSGGAGAAVFETYLNIQTPIVNNAGLMQKFYQSHPDSFFQTVYFTNFTQDLTGGFAYEINISNNIQGIGLGVFDNTAFVGSNGVLESLCNMNRLAVWPSDPENRFFGGGNNFLTIMGQEAGHRWGAFPNFVDANGDTSNLILGRADAHWSYYFDVDHSSLEGGNWEFSFGNNFTTPTNIDFFGDIDEYIMGLRTPEEVKPSFFVSSPSNDAPGARAQGTPLINTFAQGTAVDVTIQDIIAAEGPRLPAVIDAPKDFRQAFILLIQNGNTPTQSDLNKIANFRRTWEDYFERAVDGRMTLNTSVTRTFPVAVISGTVTDEMTNQPVENITVRSTERGFEQFVPGGGRYTFRYMADENAGAAEAVTIIVEAENEAGQPYLPDTLTTNITYGTEMVFDFQLQLDPTSVENVAGEIPAFDGLDQNYPNPFNPSTTIKFDLSAAAEVTLNIYNMKGQLVRQLLSEKLSAGSHTLTWDAKSDRAQQLPSGLYVSRLQAGDFVQHRKMLLIR